MFSLLMYEEMPWYHTPLFYLPHPLTRAFYLKKGWFSLTALLGPIIGPFLGGTYLNRSWGGGGGGGRGKG